MKITTETKEIAILELNGDKYRWNEGESCFEQRDSNGAWFDIDIYDIVWEWNGQTVYDALSSLVKLLEASGFSSTTKKAPKKKAIKK